VAPGTHAEMELEDGSTIYVPIMYLTGPCGESLYWGGIIFKHDFHKS
jgi:hypothetical protein